LTSARLAAVAFAAALAGAVLGYRLARTPQPPGRETLRVGTAATVAAPPPALADGPVRNVILLVGDGMGFAQIAAGRIAALGPEGRLRFERFPTVGVLATHADSDLITKSDAAATALASGVKTRNGHVGTDPAGKSLPTLVEMLRDGGWATGLATTTCMTDATPAAFAAHVASRRDEVEIAAQLSAARIDLLAGAASSCSPRGTLPWVQRPDGRDLIAEMRRRGVEVVRDAAGFEAAAALPLAALFDVEAQRAEPRSPTLEALARKALDLLARPDRPFFLLLEEEEIDSAAHDNDGARMSAALMRFDAAVGVAVDFAARDGKTLVLVLADHGTGGLSLDVRSRGKDLVLAWGSGKHSGEPVPVFAYGPPSAAGRFAGMHDNSEIPRLIAAGLGVDWPPAAVRE
jgi:alkaline phosphatase